MTERSFDEEVCEQYFDIINKRRNLLKHKLNLETVFNTPDDAATGYMVEVDLEFPEELPDKIKEYPPGPESIKPKPEWLSQSQADLTNKVNAKPNIQKQFHSYVHILVMFYSIDM